jgi:hypothetical protein
MGSRTLLGVWLVSFGLLPSAASATVWQVTNTGDGPFTCPSASACTLRGAIAQADSDSGSEVVRVPSGHYTVNVNPIYVTNGMQIVGTAGSAATTVEHAGGAAGILAISSGATDVTVSGLTLTGGQEPNGGAIASQASALTLSRDVFTNNAPASAGTQGIGGAVDVFGSGPKALTVEDSTFRSNRAGGDGGNTNLSGFGRGGAITFVTGGTLTITESVFALNKAGGNGGGPSGSQSGAGNGGAIWVSPATATDNVQAHVARSVFAGNRAGGSGGAGSSSGRGTAGAIGVETDIGNGSLTVVDSTFSGNLAGGPGGSGVASGIGNGGALGMFGSDGSVVVATITRSSFADNRAGGDGTTAEVAGQGGGGGFYFSSDSVKSEASATNSTFSGNRAGGVAGTGMNSGEANGGTITASTPGSLALTNDTLVGGVAGGENGRGGNLGTLGTGTTKLKNTILSHGVADAGANCNRPITSLGHNIETANDCGLTAAGDRPGTEPMLHALASNGGPSQTIAPMAGSPAIDGGDNAGCPAMDQRGALRPAGAACDIGAFEVAAPRGTTGAATSVGPRSARLSGIAFNPDLARGSAVFQLGHTRAYGRTAGRVAVAPVTRTRAVATTVTGLKPHTTYHFRMDVTNAAGTAVGADRTFTTPAVAAISKLRLRPSKIRAESGSGPATTRSGRNGRGATLSFRASEAGLTTATVQSRRRGHYTRAGSFKLKTRAGANRRHFTGRVKRRPLRAGRYRLKVVETDTGGHKGRPRTVIFRIVG